jgi:carboxypeptidase C (cathepsin A)
MHLEGKSIDYEAVTGSVPLLDEKGEVTAEIFFVAYNKEDEDPDRPITFIFPGGPGGSGTTEAILTFGPRRLLTASEGRTVLPPYRFIDNPQTLLEFTDLVFVDPVNCGYSRATEEGSLFSFYSIEGDIQSLGEFIRNYISAFDRWNSPKYLAGGSYGTPRCAGLALNLLQYGIAVHGIILHGCALEFSTFISERDRPLPNCLLIPTLAATAWYHGRLWPEKPLSEVIDYARRFAFDHYAPVMLQPNRLDCHQKTEFYRQLAELIGLSPNTVQRYNGRISEEIYSSEFFAPERKILGRLDTRYSGDVSSIDPDYQTDPSNFDSLGIECAFQAYLQKELRTPPPSPDYISFSHEANTHWYFGTFDSFGTPNLLQRLRHVLVFNPLFKIFVGSGYYDCRTPFAATEYCFDHLDLPESYRKNLQFEYYEAGHGFILDHESLDKMKNDLIRFYGE